MPRMSKGLDLNARTESLECITHDIKNLMSVILLSLDSARRGAPSASRDAIVTALDAARSAAELCTVACSERASTLSRGDVVALTGVVGDAAHLLRPVLPGTVTLRVDVPAGLTVRGNQPELTRVILNLGINAGHAMPNGGRLTIRARPARVRRDTPDPAVDFVLLVIEDTGSGMDAETVACIFEPGYTTKGSNGSGLGAFTAQRIVVDHGGSIVARSAPRRGTTIYIYLPAAPAEPS